MTAARALAPAILTCLILATIGCSGHADIPDAGATARSGPRTEPIATRMGGREVRVHCGVECPEITGELSSLHEDCIADPLSTPHHVSTQSELVSLGCCTVARTAYEQACGIEGAISCVSAWGAHCDSGDVSEHRHGAILP